MLSCTVSVICCVIAGQHWTAVSSFTPAEETTLKTALFTTAQYDKTVRPAQQTTVTLSLAPTSLNLIDIKAQTMSISGWWNFAWTDSRLSWTPSSHGSIDEIYVFEDDVWFPTIVVYNSVNDLSAIDQDTIPIRVKATGEMEWNPPGILTVSCDTDITYFPFDSQTCGVSVKSFGYQLNQLILVVDADELDLNYYSPNGEWTLLKYWTTTQNLYNYSLVTFSFKFERLPEFYGMNMIFPVIVMAIMGLFLFLLPAESGEKMGYSLTVLLTFVVLMTLLADKMPSTAENTSYFEVYLILVLALCALSVLLSIISLNLYFREEDEPIPSRAKSLTRFIERLMCRNGNQPSNQTANQTLFSRSSTQVHALPAKNTEKSDATTQPSALSPGSRPDADTHGQPEVTWKRMSMLMDAFFLRVYVVAIIFLTILFLCLLTIK